VFYNNASNARFVGGAEVIECTQCLAVFNYYDDLAVGPCD